MIKGITGGQGIIAGGGSVSYPYIPMNNNNPIQGMLRLNGQDMQVFDGSSWITLSASYATVELDASTQSILQWAREKRDEESQLKAIALSHPAVAIAINAVKKAEEQLDLVVKLSKEHGETVETSQF